MVPPPGLGTTLRLAQPALSAGGPENFRFDGEPKPDTGGCERNRRGSRGD